MTSPMGGRAGDGPDNLVLQKLISPIDMEMAVAVRRRYWFVILERIIYDFLDCFLHIKLFLLFDFYSELCVHVYCFFFFILVKYTKRILPF